MRETIDLYRIDTQSVIYISVAFDTCPMEKSRPVGLVAVNTQLQN